MVLFASQAAAAIANARTHRDVQRARADLEALVETSPFGVAVFDPGTGRIASINREAHRMAEAIRTPGSPPEQLLEVLTCRREDGREFSLADFPLAEHLKNATGMRAEEIELSVPDGRSVRLLINVTPLHAEDSGEAVSVVVTMQDLAPFEELERQRADFLRMVSHELRAPLASIKGSAGTVLEASPPASRAEMVQFFRLINGQANHMRGLVANLLDAGSIEAGTLTVAPEPTSVAALVDRARTTFLSGGSRHPVLVDLPPDLPGAMADRGRIEQVLNNLFSNAARHAPETSPIRVEAAREGMHVAISVSDEGRGIAPDELPHLFRKRPGLMGGTGLGLAICKGLVEAHGGRIRAESGGPGLGARFTFTLPVAAGTVEAVHAGGGVRATPDGRARVLVVDDDPQMLRFVRDALGAAGFTPLATADPRELSHLLETERPDLVLLDLILPGTDGIELMKRMPELSDLPVIFISGYGNDETIAKALELGAADYIVKPFSPTELTARVRAALRRQAEPEAFVLGDLRISYDRRRVTLAGCTLKLTAKEYDLLSVLSRNAGRVVTYEALLRQVWNRRGGGKPGPVRTYVRKLRHKLGDDAADPSYILTERAVGYRMPEPESGENP
ncbi:MAG: response regulator [Gemmatimonadota bacterium]|uniref:response regulator n=1 Tax=Candidatus Palauibacter scopulicola TaxID=3056741 RepID=UPI00238C3DCC|nr:response regulator [Candidatus Palauibacter scopulicola]MDE2663225.1 response regulator [Candidatus Palauibacter scopulicola]